jgi:glucose-induced degradation protein 8
VAGYPNAAAKFSTEANLQPQQDDVSITARQQIQNSIHRGDIQAAIDALNELDSEVRFEIGSIMHPTMPLAMIRNRVLHAPLLRSPDQ